MLINPNEINKILNLTETRKINLGKKMFEQNRVKIIDVNIKNSDNYSIEAVIYDPKNNNQFVSVVKKNNNINLKCDCKEYSANYATCSHLIALIFDIYVNPEKYEYFEKDNNLIGIISSKSYKSLPEIINKTTIYNYICDILSKNNLEYLYDFTKDIIKKRAYKTYLSAVGKILCDSGLKVFEYEEKNPEVEFVINKVNNDIVITSNIYEYKFCMVKEKLVYVHEEFIYTCSSDFILNVLPYILFLNNIKNNTIRMSELEFKNLYKKFLCNVFRYGSTRDYNNILHDFEVREFDTKMYLDVDDKKNIVLTLGLEYGKNEINPLSKLESNSVERNEFLELTIIKMLSDIKFKIDNKKEVFYIDNDDDKFEFLKNGIKYINSKYKVFVTDKFKKKQIITTHKNNIGVSIRNNLVELDFDNLKYSNEEISEIIKSYKINKKYYKLKNDDYLNLEDENIKNAFDILNELNISNADARSGKIVVPKYKALYLDKILSENKKVKTNFSDEFKNIVNDVKYFKNINYNVPECLDKKLREYQVDGYKWLKTLQHFEFGGILADDMGLGKTLEMIAILVDSKNNNKNVSLVVCPTSLCFNWQKEIEKFAKDMKTLVIYGNQKNRENLIKKIKKYDIIVTSYDLIKRDIEKYLQYEFDYVIADEAQYIKNNNTQNSKAIKKINAKNRIALTGTPIENNLSELWSIFDFIMPGYLFSYSKFKELYEKKIVIEDDKEAYNKLITLISPFILRRKKKEVLNDLPVKTETLLYSDMLDEQKELYNVFLDDTKQKIMEYSKKEFTSQNKIEILSLITRLRQICIHPKMFISNYAGESSKLEQMVEILKEAIISNHKVLVFSGFTSMLEIIEERLDLEKIKYLKLTGKTKNSERLELVDRFNNSEDVSVFLVSLKAGGTGLNLIGADMVIHLDPWWNTAKEEQATDRAYRIGQKRNVQVFKFITRDSIEEKILKMQERKSDLVDKIIRCNNNELKFNFDEIMQILEL